MADIHFTTTLGGPPTDLGYFGILPGQTPMAPTPGGPLGPLLKAVVPVLSWLAPAVGFASALFPGAASAIQGIGNIVGGLFGGAPNPAAPAVAAPPTMISPLPGPGPMGGAGIFNPIAVPFDETSLLAGPMFPSMVVAQGGVGTGMMTIAGQALVRAFPALEAVVPKLLTRLPQAAALASAIYATYQGLRAAGQNHATAKRTALAAHGVRLRRRRMRVTNIKALRRAGRRVHGFQRVARKLGALHVTGRGRRVFAGGPRRRYRVHRRGDISPFMVEDFEDMTDQLEDDGYSPDTFLDDGYAAAGE